MDKKQTKKQPRFFEKALERRKREIRAVYISTYIPRKCGLATYTKDLTNAINVLNPTCLAEIMALNCPDLSCDYPWEVKFRIGQGDLKSYLAAADYLNQSSAELVCLQHEFGIFGGKNGEYVIPLLRGVKKPVVTTLHTVPSNPTPHQQYLISEIAKFSRAVTVMVKVAANRLARKYSVPKEKIIVIPHGVPDIHFSPADLFKKETRLSGRVVISSMGLISSNKGLEYVVSALPHLVKKFPNILFLMVGVTHPVVLKWEGERYRRRILRLAKELKVRRSMRVINRYLPLESLINFLKATDIYVTPHLGLGQTSSGTLAYAIGAGKVCISTPYLYAKETLRNHRGILVSPRDPKAIAEAVEKVLTDSEFREKIERRAYKFGRLMIWSNIALRYLDLFQLVLGRNDNKQHA